MRVLVCLVFHLFITQSSSYSCSTIISCSCPCSSDISSSSLSDSLSLFLFISCYTSLFTLLRTRERTLIFSEISHSSTSYTKTSSTERVKKTKKKRKQEEEQEYNQNNVCVLGKKSELECTEEQFIKNKKLFLKDEVTRKSLRMFQKFFIKNTQLSVKVRGDTISVHDIFANDW